MSLEFSPAPDAALFAAEAAQRSQMLALRDAFVSALAQPPQRLAAVAGNLLIHVPNAATWTLVTSGPRLGLHDGLTDDEVDFALWCDGAVLLQLFAGQRPTRLTPGALRTHGDPQVLVRFATLLAE